MDKLKMHSINKVEDNIKKIGELFPNALTEVIKGYRADGSAIIEQAIDFDVLRQELSSVLVEGPAERYQFTWPDKRKSILLANAPIAKTLRLAGRKVWLLIPPKTCILRGIIWMLSSCYRRLIWVR
ncbi:hypothetical protein [Desulforamulus profundi]|uniref:hypothetical protein n=1 Tax=Desulforamulus profundi TaxID=1383067 RepID=UPI003083A7AA